MSKQPSIEKVLTDLAKQLAKIRTKRGITVNREAKRHFDTMTVIDETYAAAESEWWATIPDGMQPLVEEAYSKLEDRCSTAQQTQASKTSG